MQSSFSFIMKPFKWLLSSHLLQKILLRKPNKPIPSIFRALLVYPISELKKERRSGTPIIVGLFQGTADGYIRPTAEQRPFIWFQQKQHEGKFSTQNQSEVRRLIFLGVSCQVGQHSRLSCNSPGFLRGGFYAGRGVEAAQPNWLSEIRACLHLKCPPSLQPHNLVRVWTRPLIKTNGTIKYASMNSFNKLCWSSACRDFGADINF